MSKVWKILAVLLAVTALVWLSTLWRWESSQFDPGSADLVLNLALLPLALTAGLVFTVWAVRRLRRYAAAPVALPAAAGPGAPATASGDAALLAPQRPRAKVLVAAVQLRAGTEWRSVQQAIGQGDCKADLDPDIKDDEGVAVFTAAMPELDTEAVAAEAAVLVQAWAASTPDAWAHYEPPVEALRALTLLRDVLAELAEPLEAQWPALAPVASPNRAAPMPPEVSVRVGIPAQWSAQTQRLATAWIEAQVAPLLSAARAAALGEHPNPRAQTSAVQLHVHPMEHAEALWQHGERQLQLWLNQKQAGLLVLVGADSGVSELAVAELAARQELFSGANPRGRVPGEGAGALVWATPDWPELPGAEPPLCWLQSARVMRRDKSADALGRVGPTTMVNVATDAAVASGWSLEAVAHLTSDADQRGSRASELFEAVQSALPHLDATQDVLRLGVGCGDLGLARLLACAGLSARQVQQSEAPVMVLGALPAFERFALLLTPTAEPASDPKPAAAAAAAA
ncbi:MAG: hypothetical protein RJA98_1776 [Pseudomonadota bacterium]|jgi:hypothetical protein